MDEGEQRIDEVLRATQVGDTLQMTVAKAGMRAEARDRVAPVLQAVADPNGSPKLEGFVKDASGEWDLESVKGPKDAVVVEIVVRRIASSL
jgi:hypothetical protein